MLKDLSSCRKLNAANSAMQSDDQRDPFLENENLQVQSYTLKIYGRPNPLQRLCFLT